MAVAVTLGRKPGLSARVCTSLDAVRASAAFYVLLHHVGNARGWSHGAGLWLRFGQEAVLVFFLLSGFLIFANERTRATRPKGYYLRRIRRIYPGVVAAMLVSTLVAVDNQTFSATFNWAELVGTGLSLQDLSALKPGVIVNPYLMNSPLWSLSYEVAFYIVFPFVLRAWLRRPRLTNHFVGSLCCLSYVLYLIAPNHWCLVLAYFLVWWCGAMAAAAYFDGGVVVGSIGSPIGWLIALNTIAALATVIVGYRGLGLFPFLMFRHFSFAIVVLAVSFGPIGAWLADQLEPVSSAASEFASVSYGIYVLHFPILVDWHRSHTGWGLAAAAVLLAGTAFVCDRQSSRWLPRAPAS